MNLKKILICTVPECLTYLHIPAITHFPIVSAELIIRNDGSRFREAFSWNTFCLFVFLSCQNRFWANKTRKRRFLWDVHVHHWILSISRPTHQSGKNRFISVQMYVIHEVITFGRRAYYKAGKRGFLWDVRVHHWILSISPRIKEAKIASYLSKCT